MIIKHLSIKNKNIDIYCEKIDFSNLGIYFFEGDNGSGKTSLIKKIIFDKLHSDFATKKQLQAYENNRAGLISYVQQETLNYNIKVIDYILKENKNITINIVKDYFKKFSLEDNLLEKNFNLLSGGERKKIAIISAIVKDCPYIILDEPTNHLDNSSVRDFIKIINELREIKTIIIISHDNRVKFNDISRFKIENGQVFQIDKAQNNKNKEEPKVINQNYFKIAMKINNSKINNSLNILLLIILIFGVLFLNLQFQEGYSVEDLPNKNIIMAYKADYVYGDLNKTYATSQNLTINKEKYYDVIEYNELLEINDIKGIDKIILFDNEYISNIFNEMKSEGDLEELHLISIPNQIRENFSQNIASPIDFSILEKGVFPRDYENEIVLSKKQLIEFYNYNENTVYDSIGENIIYNGKLYTIVGISYYDIGYISFDENKNYGFYTLKEDTIDEFINRNVEFKIKDEYQYHNNIDDMFILTKDGFEKEVLNEIFSNNPAENYYSNYYADQWKKEFNSDFMKKLSVKSVVFSLLISIILIYIKKNQIIMDARKIKDFKNYYINNKIEKWYIVYNVSIYLLLMSIAIIFNTVYSSYSKYNSSLLLFNVVIILLSSIVGYFIINIKESKYEDKI